MLQAVLVLPAPAQRMLLLAYTQHTGAAQLHGSAALLQGMPWHMLCWKLGSVTGCGNAWSYTVQQLRSLQCSRVGAGVLLQLRYSCRLNCRLDSYQHCSLRGTATLSAS